MHVHVVLVYPPDETDSRSGDVTESLVWFNIIIFNFCFFEKK